MTNLVFQQFGRQDLKCSFDDPLVRQTLPDEVLASVIVAFGEDSSVALLTVSWHTPDEPDPTKVTTGTFRRADPDEELLPAIVVLGPRSELAPDVKEAYLNRVKEQLEYDE